MAYHRIKYYPVDNGDTTLISLKDNTNILIDTNITLESENDDSKKYDVKADLLKELNQDGDIFFTDAFVLTHPDQDHIRNFKKNFYVGDPSNIGDSAVEDELIRIDELWFSPKVFDKKDDICNDAEDFRKEAKRRIKLHKEGNDSKDLPGNRIVIIGYSDSAEIEGLEKLVYIPGTTITKINQKDNLDFNFFVHAPFKDDTDNVEDRNDTSIILQAVFDVGNHERAGLVIFGGDAGWRIWKKVLDKSENNDLEWDILLAPHHCSWGFFNDSPNDNNYIATESSREILEKSRPGAWVISSSRLFQKDTPPNRHAKDEFVEAVGDEKFLITADHPTKKGPQPIVFRITSQGPQKESVKKAGNQNAQGAVGGIVTSYG